ncbi:helix-turn-helix domain-containing protein [Roseomonas sp. HJA6]|uniref:Helix-turn-helix domain-containing protein n=1 Tax=Roseomonas alba TaxID=2846776 RepID=A0ABS7A3P2_9PROT|nr:helix-turn-helix domain-containing protein [Neoroseomonas alba]
MSRTDITKRYVTVPQATEMFSISKQTLYRLRKEGGVRMLKAGRRTLVEVASVEEHLHRNPVGRVVDPDVRHRGVAAH